MNDHLVNCKAQRWRYGPRCVYPLATEAAIRGGRGGIEIFSGLCVNNSINYLSYNNGVADFQTNTARENRVRETAS